MCTHNILFEQYSNRVLDLKFNVTSVTRLQNRHKSPIPIVTVILDKSEKNIFSLDRLLQCIITVENRKTDNSIPQCQNCQRFNHTKNFCKLPPRCVKCPEQHHYSECTKDSNSPPTCVNCNENHPANYKGCKIYKQIKNHSKASLIKTHLNIYKLFLNLKNKMHSNPIYVLKQ